MFFPWLSIAFSKNAGITGKMGGLRQADRPFFQKTQRSGTLFPRRCVCAFRALPSLFCTRFCTSKIFPLSAQFLQHFSQFHPKARPPHRRGASCIEWHEHRSVFHCNVKEFFHETSSLRMRIFRQYVPSFELLLRSHRIYPGTSRSRRYNRAHWPGRSRGSARPHRAHRSRRHRGCGRCARRHWGSRTYGAHRGALNRKVNYL